MGGGGGRAGGREGGRARGLSRQWDQGLDSVSAPCVVLFFNDEPKAFACLHQLVNKLMPRVRYAHAHQAPTCAQRHVRPVLADGYLLGLAAFRVG